MSQDDEALDPAFIDAMHALVQLFGRELDEDGMERLARILVDLVNVARLVEAYEAAHGATASSDTPTATD
jgi:hypothetical protein